MTEAYEVIIVGGGTAGLSAALILGRCRRRVVVCSVPDCRNQCSYAMYGFLSRDGICPEEFIKESRKQLSKYPNIEFKDVPVKSIQRHKNGFNAFLENKTHLFAQKIILATGIKDEIPQIPGIYDYFGKSIFLCPYCDAWEFKDQPIAVYGQGDRGPKYALLLRKWTDDIILCNDGVSGGTLSDHKKLNQWNIRIIESPLAGFQGKDGQLESIVFKDRTVIPRKSLFFNTPIYPNSQIAIDLGCKLTPKGEVLVTKDGLTSVEGVYAAGDLASNIKLAIIAAAGGVKAAYALNHELLILEGHI